MSVPSSLVPKSLTPVTSALEKFLLREEEDEEAEGKRDGSGLYIPKSASAEAALASGKITREEREDESAESHPESGLEKY